SLAPGRLRGGHGGHRTRSVGSRGTELPRRPRARPAASRPGRAPGVPAHPGGRERHADSHVDGAPRHRRPGPRARRRGGRLPRQALCPGRTVGSAPRPLAATLRRRRRAAPLRGAHLGPRLPGGAPGPTRLLPGPDRVRSLGAVPPPPPPGAHPGGAAQPRLGLRLRFGNQFAGGIRRLSAAQDRGGWRAALHSHSARRGIRAPGHVTFRTRLVLATTVAVVAAVLVASTASFLAARNSLLGGAANSLTAAATKITAGQQISATTATLGQGIDSAGAVVSGGGWPGTPQVRLVAAGLAPSFFTTVTVGGDQLREFVEPLPAGTAVETGILAEGGALQIATLLNVESVLARLGIVLGAVALTGVLLAVVLGWLVAQTALVPLNALTATVEDLAEPTD